MVAYLLVSIVACETSPTDSPTSPPSTGGSAPAWEREWVLQRIEAVSQLYSITPEGLKVLRALDVRQMRGQPGWFGSYGFKEWTGVGEAKPGAVMHELSHAYWGAFPVTGFPELSWGDTKGRTSAMERYHRDVLKFMQQPPDHYEALRARLPKDDTGALFHLVEADLVGRVAGDLNLLPPILRKYWDRFLGDGPFHSWYGAMAWYQSLSKRDRALSNQYIGFEHFDLRQYKSLQPSTPSRLETHVKESILNEGRQRLWDFADQFDSLLGDPEGEENFHFWRGYLRQMLSLHKEHPGHLMGLDMPRASQIAEALDFLEVLERVKPEQRPNRVTQQLSEQPFLIHFLPALDNRTLLEIFTSGAELPDRATIKGTADFVKLLQSVSPQVDKILDAGRENTDAGAEELKRFLMDVDFGAKAKLDLFFEVFQDSDDDTAKLVVASLDNATLRQLFNLTEQGYLPARMRALLAPRRLLEIIGITSESSAEMLAEGIRDIVEHPAGNSLIDEPFIEAMYQIIATRGQRRPREALAIISNSPFPMEHFILDHPIPVVRIMATDPDVTVGLVANSDTLIFPPARFVYRLIHADPEFAAEVVERLDQAGEDDIVLEALAHFAYDADRLEAVPGLPVSLEKDGRFLSRLLEVQGIEWLEGRMGEVVKLYRERVDANESPRDFLEAYKRTLVAAASEIKDQTMARSLEEVIGLVFQ